MPTNLARVTVSPIEARHGWIATCSRCSWRIVRPSRLMADVAGQAHQREHVIPDPRDQINVLGELT